MIHKAEFGFSEEIWYVVTDAIGNPTQTWMNLKTGKTKRESEFPPKGKTFKKITVNLCQQPQAR